MRGDKQNRRGSDCIVVFNTPPEIHRLVGMDINEGFMVVEKKKKQHKTHIYINNDPNFGG